MSIGIMDADMAQYTVVPFNLECMKLSAYYKRKNEIVVLSQGFHPERHETYFYRKDYADGNFPHNVTKYPNIDYGGYAFANNNYVPLPINIELMKPDTSLYLPIEKEFATTYDTKRIYKALLKAENCRLSLDGKTIWPDYEAQLKDISKARTVIFHDQHLEQIDGAYEEIQKLLEKGHHKGWNTRVGMKFPVVVNNGEDLLKWSRLEGDCRFYSLRYNGIMSNEDFISWLETVKTRNIFKQVEYHVTDPSIPEKEFIEKHLSTLLHQILIARTQYVFFSLYYDKGYFTDPRWERVLDLFNLFHSSMHTVIKSQFIQRIQDDTVFDFAAHSATTPYRTVKDGMCREDIRRVFAFVNVYNYPLFKEFYETTAESLGGML